MKASDFFRTSPMYDSVERIPDTGLDQAVLNDLVEQERKAFLSLRGSCVWVLMDAYADARRIWLQASREQYHDSVAGIPGRLDAYEKICRVGYHIQRHFAFEIARAR